MCDLIRRYRPTLILTHWRGSMHRDHVATYDIVADAIFYAGLPAIRRELPSHRARGPYFPENWEDMDGWRADVYLDVSDVWDDYLAVLRSHEFIRGGVSSFRYLDYYDSLGTTRGCLGGFRKAVSADGAARVLGAAGCVPAGVRPAHVGPTRSAMRRSDRCRSCVAARGAMRSASKRSLPCAGDCFAALAMTRLAPVARFGRRAILGYTLCNFWR